MNKYILLGFLLSTLALNNSCIEGKDNLIEKVYLNNGWFFSFTDSPDFPASVPGCIHTDLFENGLIPDPFIGNNEIDLQWIGEEDWYYKNTFIVYRDYLDKSHIELVFEGLDTYAAVFLNGQKILQSNNMFREWKVECRDLLNIGENKLEIFFSSPVTQDSINEAENEIMLPDSRAYTRKAPYHYGWDWGPKFVTMGIWKPVYLKAWDDLNIKDVFVRQKSLTDDLASYIAEIEIQSDIENDCNIEIKDKTNEMFLAKERIKVSNGDKMYQVNFNIKDPILWWSNGLGDAFLYELELTFETKEQVWVKIFEIGVRTIELIQEPDSVGASFCFELNGVPVFMKGANYIPQNSFPSEVSSSNYRDVIKSAVDANMNMLRVWGGGIYENDEFYNLCDENGILVWQDFMFACNMYPGDEDFLNNVSKEAEYQVKRLRNHPSLALWCGNNEVNEGWFNWGWQKALSYSKEDSLKVWNDYQKLFEDILPSIVRNELPGCDYWPSSPKTGWGHEEAKYSGDMHYWGVWWGAEPFEIYEDKVGRFMTEYGFQGFPDWKTIQTFTRQEELNFSDENFLNHQKHPRGLELIHDYMEREFPVPDDLFEYTYMSQLVQAEGVNMALEAHRRAMPYCMGTLYWQLNDCWPVISWSSVDYYNRWKALHYFIQKTFENITISLAEENDKLNIYVINDLLNEVNGKLRSTLMDFEGNIFYETESNVSLALNSSEIYDSIRISDLLKEHQPNMILLYVNFTSEDGQEYDRIKYFSPVKDLILPEVEINVVKNDDGKIVISADKLVKNIYLFHPDMKNFKKNYFDLLPNKPFILEENIDPDNLQISCLNNIKL